MQESDRPERCDCGDMVRDYGAERPNVGNREYSRPIVSHSLAINPSQAAEHRRLFPDVKLQDDTYPVFDSYRTHDAYLKKIGAVKKPQKVRNRGRRLATQGK